MSWYKKSDIDYTAPFFQEVYDQPLIPSQQMVYWLKNNKPNTKPPAVFLLPKNKAAWTAAQQWYQNLQQTTKRKPRQKQPQPSNQAMRVADIEKTCNEINQITDNVLQYMAERVSREDNNPKSVEVAKKLGLVIESYVRMALNNLYNSIWTDQSNTQEIESSPFYKEPGEAGMVYIRPQQTGQGYSERIFRNIGSKSPLANIDWSKLTSMEPIAEDLYRMDQDIGADESLFRAPPTHKNPKEEARLRHNWGKTMYMYGEKLLNDKDPQFQTLLKSLSTKYSIESVMAFLSIIKGITRESLSGNPESAQRRNFTPAYQNYGYLMQQYKKKAPNFQRKASSNWYKRSQFVNDNMLAEGIYQRLVQLRDNVMADANAFDDIHSQGKSLGEIESAISKAVYKYLNGIGDESMLNEGQRNLIATLRGQMPEQPMGDPVEPQMQENIDPLKSV